MKFTLETATILGPMSNGDYWPLIGAQGLNTIVGPVGKMKAIYRAGTQPFGGVASLQIGYAFNHSALGLGSLATMESVDQFVEIAQINPISSRPLSDLANQPVVASFNTNQITRGPILTSSISSAGSGFSVNDELSPDDIGEWTLTVTAVDGGGAITGYTVDSGVAVLGNDQAVSGGGGSGFTLNVLTVLQGNGLIEVFFQPEVTRIG